VGRLFGADRHFGKHTLTRFIIAVAGADQTSRLGDRAQRGRASATRALVVVLGVRVSRQEGRGSKSWVARKITPEFGGGPRGACAHHVTAKTRKVPPLGNQATAVVRDGR